MGVITLTCGLAVEVDDQDEAFVLAHHWTPKWNKGSAYLMGTVNGELKSLHRCLGGDPDGLTVDHRDGNTLNNRRSNLRTATSQQQSMNRRSANKHGLKGVYKPVRGRWHAQIWVAGRHVNSGPFDTKEEAARWYDRMARETFGEFARCNFDN